MCFAEGLLERLDSPTREIASMSLEGPEADEYRHEDVWRAMNALGIEVELDDVKAHRLGRCSCRLTEETA